MRAAANRPFRVRFRVEGEDGFLVDVDPATDVAVVVKDGAGVQIASGTAVHEATGVYHYTVPAQTQLDVLTAVATATVAGDVVTVTQTVRLIDRRVVSLSQLRALPSLAPLDVIDFLDVVDQAEDWVTGILNYSPVVTADRVVFRINDFAARLRVPGIYHPRTMYALTFDDRALDTSGFVVRGHALEYAGNYYGAPYDPVIGTYGGGWTPGVYNAYVSHGLSEVPNELLKATAMLANHIGKSAGSSLPDRAVRVITEMSEIFLSSPDGDKRLTGLPEVDGVLLRYRLFTPFADDALTFSSH